MNNNIFLIIFLFNFLGASSMSDFSFEQSSTQAFYYIDEVLIDGEPIELDDWVVAYKNNTLLPSKTFRLASSKAKTVFPEPA